MGKQLYNQNGMETILLKYSYNHTQCMFIKNIQSLSQGRQDARLILFYKIINSLAQVPFEGILIEAYKGTRRKLNMEFKQIGHTIRQYGQSFSPKTISPCNGIALAEALAVFSKTF